MYLYSSLFCFVSFSVGSSITSKSAKVLLIFWCWNYKWLIITSDRCLFRMLILVCSKYIGEMSVAVTIAELEHMLLMWRCVCVVVVIYKKLVFVYARSCRVTVVLMRRVFRLWPRLYTKPEVKLKNEFIAQQNVNMFCFIADIFVNGECAVKCEKRWRVGVRWGEVRCMSGCDGIAAVKASAMCALCTRSPSFRRFVANTNRSVENLTLWGSWQPAVLLSKCAVPRRIGRERRRCALSVYVYMYV
jgi:hypothetical protein